MCPTRDNIRFWAVVPAAGVGRRMGGVKQTLPYGRSTMAGTVVRTALDAGVDGVVVVTRTTLVPALALPDDPRVATRFNDAPESDMIDSIRIGLSSLADRGPTHGGGQATDGVLVVPADMPTISVDAYRLCMAAFAADPLRIVIATHAGRRGHPMIFPVSLRGAVMRLRGGLRVLPQRYCGRVQLVETDDPGVTRDIDTAADYRDV
ncbi:MAG: NTP transferase domain-containing protein [Phycisphaerae bacterium]